ncbi:MAG: ABC transporter permease [Pyrinomonadaceae bacterium]
MKENVIVDHSELAKSLKGGEVGRRQFRGRGAATAPQWFHPLKELTKTRLREFLREPEAVFWVFVFPVLLACALGIAFRNTGPEKVRVGVESSGGGADQLRAALANSPEVEVVTLSATDAPQALRQGSVALIVRSAGAPLADAGGATTFDYRFDPTRPESRLARLTVDDVLQRSAGRRDAAVTRDERVSEPGARYIDFLIPGLVGLNLMGSGLWGLGFAVVQARSRKLLKRFAVTPMRRSHYLLSFIFSRLVFLFLEVAAIVGFAWLAFGVQIKGSLLGFALITLTGSVAFAGLGLLIAARPRTVEGVSGWMNFVMLPMWLLSGTFFSSERFPEILQPFIKALPLTAINDALRSVMNEGAPILDSWPQILVLLAWAGLSFFFALRLFRWQ